MNERHDAQHDALLELFDAICDGRASDAQHAELHDLLRRDEAAKRLYVAYLNVHAELQWRMRDEPAQAGMADGPIERRADETPVAGGSPDRRWWGRAAAVAAAVLVIGAVAAAVLMTLDGGDEAGERLAAEPVGVLLAAGDVSWASEPIAPGADVAPGVIRIDSGRLDLELRSGVAVALRGPAELDLRSAMNGRLGRGTLAAYVPAEAAGFTVETERFTVEDLGTEFELSVNADGSGVVRVFDGSVRLDDGTIVGDGALTLHAGQGMRFGADGRRTSLAVHGPGVDATPPAYVHYGFEENGGATVVDRGVGIAGGPFDGKTIGASAAEGLRDAGRFGRALRLDGRTYVDTGYAGVGGGGARTVAFWIKVDADASGGDGEAVVGWGEADVAGRGWQIGWDNWGNSQTRGAVRLVTGEKSVLTGTADLRDGTWRHVAVVLAPGADADGAAPRLVRDVRLYIDGEPEAVGREYDAQIDTLTSAGARPLRLGWGLRTDAPAFRGLIDELYVFDGALDDDQVRRLYELNTPPGRSIIDRPEPANPTASADR